MRAATDPDDRIAIGMCIDTHVDRRIVAHLAPLADAIAACQRAQRFALRDVSRDQAVGRARCRVLDDADTGRKRTHDDLIAVLRICCAGARIAA